MGGFLKQATGSQARVIGPFVDDTDGKTAETGLTIANTDIRLSANGGNIVAKNSGGGTHDELGYYTITFDSTDTAAVGSLKLICKMSGALVVEDEYWVLEEAIYDALFGASATGLLPANVTQFGGSNGTFSSGRPEVNSTHWAGTAVASANVLIDGAITAAKIASDAITAAKIADGAIDAATFAAGAITASAIAADAIGASELASDAIAEIQSGLATASALTTVEGKIDTIDGIVDDILADTVEIGTAGAGLTEAGGTGDHLTSLPWNAAWDAEVQSEAADALAAYDPPTKAELDSAVAPLAAAADLATVAGYIDTEIAGIITTLGTPAGASVSADVAAVKSQTAAIQADTEDIQSRLPAALTGDGNIKADALRIAGSDTAATNLSGGARALVLGSCASGSSSTSVITTLTEATNDHYNGRVITFTSGALVGQSTDITDYDGASKTLTVTALTESPAENDTFVIS